MKHFDSNSGLVLVYVGLIKTNIVTFDHVPVLLNLREIVTEELKK